MPNLRTLLALVVLAIAGPAMAQPLYISEFGASNATVIADEDGAFSDWVEIYNGGGSAVNLDGWYLTDTFALKTKWRFPAVTINAGQYMIVWASDKRRAIPGSPLHTNFKLSSAGEYLGLIRPDGITAESDYYPVFPVQVVDVSYGYTYVGGVLQPGARRYFTIPTPGGPNSEAPEDLGPTVVSVVNSPVQPADADNILVTTTVVRTTNPIVGVSMTYRVNYGSTTTVPMFDDGLHGDGAANDLTFGATISAGASIPGDMVRWKIAASDNASHVTNSPLFPDPLNSAEYWGTFIADGVVSTLPILRYFVETPALADTDAGTRASVFYASKFYDNVGIEIKGQSSRGWPKKSYKFQMNSGVSLEYDPAKPKIKELNMQSTYADKSFMRVVMAWETYETAQVPGSKAFLMHTRQNGQFWSVATFVEEPDDRFLERVGLNTLGALYKMNTDASTSTYLNNEKKNRSFEDFSDLQAFLTGINTVAGREVFIFDNMDLPTTVNYLAATVLMHDNDHVGKNNYLFRDSGKSNEWAMLPWDKDLTFGRNYDPAAGGVLSDTIWANNDNMSHPLFGDSAHPKIDGPWNKVINALYATPRIQQMFLRRLRTLMDLQLQAPGTDPLALKYDQRIEQLRTLLSTDTVLDRTKWGNPYGLSQTMDQAADIIKNDFLVRRRTHLFNTHSAVSGLIPQSQYAGTGLRFGAIDQSPASLNQNQEYVQIENNSGVAIDVSGWTVQGEISHTFKPGTVIPGVSSLYLTPKVEEFRARTAGPTAGQALFLQGGYSNRLTDACQPVSVWDTTGALVAAMCGCAPAISASSTTVCSGAAVTLTGPSGAEIYEWSNGAGTSSVSVSPTVTSTYSLVNWRSDLSSLFGEQLCQSARADVTINVTPQSFTASIAPGGNQSVAPAGTGSTLTASIAGAGTAPFAYQWGYRTVLSGDITPIPGATASTYTPAGANFPGSGVYQMVVTVTSACGSPAISNAVQVTITGGRTMVISDVTVLEGNTGFKNAVFTVTLSGPSTSAVTVNYATASGTASAGADYTSASGTLSIPAGSLTGAITVKVLGDKVYEPAETFTVVLSSASSGTTIADSTGVGTITDNETAPVINVNNVAITEGNSGVKVLTLTMTLSRPSYQTVSVTYQSADDTATAGIDYVAVAGALTFAPGETSKTIAVTINGDTICGEGNERFRLNLLSVTSGAASLGTNGTGRILNDDCL